MPDIMPRHASETALRETEARLVRMIRELSARFDALEVRLSALHLGSTCHPEWVAPNPGPAARARRAGIVEAVLAIAGPAGMTLAELAAYLHLPSSRRDTLDADLSYLIEEDRAERVPSRAKKWRTRGNHAP